MKQLIYLLMAAGIMFSCTSPKNIVKYTVASQTADCTGVAPQKCLLVKKGDASEWEFFYSPIEGFNYEEGYEYVLEVREDPVENVPADASSIKYTLVKEVSKTAKTSENLPMVQNKIPYIQCVGKVLEIEKVDIGRGAAQGKFSAIVVKIEVSSSTLDEIKPHDIVYCELIPSPMVMPELGREYVFKAKNLHPAHAKGVYLLETNVQDLVS